MSSAMSATGMDTPQQQTEHWHSSDQQPTIRSSEPAANNGSAEHHSLPPAHETGSAPEYALGSNVGEATNGTSSANGDSEPAGLREKQIKPNKVYIGGLPEHTRREDLQNCFGKIGNITAVELKTGYGFVEFDSREAAEMSVTKYHEGTFMGNKIRVELSRGGGRTAKYSSDPGACFRCGQTGHWARECPHHPGPPPGPANTRRNPEPPIVERMQHPRDYPTASLPPPPPREARYDYPRDYRRPPSPPRDYYPPPRSRYDEYPPRDRDRYPPPPPVDYRGGRYPDPGYRAPPPPAAPYSYDRYARPPPDSRYPASYGAPLPGRPRTPPRYRDDYPPPRDYPDYRGRPVTPPRYANDYTRGPVTPPPQDGRYRQRSASPPPRSGGYGYAPPSASTSGTFATTPPGPPPRSSRDFPPPRSSGREPAPPDSYRRP